MRWINAESPAIQCANGGAATMDFVHPVIVYEIVWNMLSMAVLWLLRDRIRPNGMLFALYLALYAVGRFAITFFREDKIWGLGMQEAHYIALVVLHHHRAAARGAGKIHEEGSHGRRRHPRPSAGNAGRAPPEGPLNTISPSSRHGRGLG